MTEEIYISLADLKRLYRRSKKLLCSIAVCAGLSVFTYKIFKEPTFLGEATFKQSASKTEQNLDLKNLFRSLTAQDDELSTVSMMLSHKLLGRTIEELGWQARVSGYAGGTVLDNIRAELGIPLTEPTPFSFRQVSFNGETPKSFYLRFQTPTSFEILTRNKTQVALGVLGEPVRAKNFSLTLVETPKDVALGVLYELKLLPVRAVTTKVKKRFSIKPSTVDRSLLCLKYRDHNRKRTTNFLNQIVASYQSFLKEENQAIADAQLKYLEKRQQELNTQLDYALQEHVSYLKNFVGENGFIGLEQGLEMLYEPQELYNSKLFNINFEISHLKESAAALDKTLPSYPQFTEAQLEEAKLLLTHLEKESPLPSLRSPVLLQLVAKLKNAPNEPQVRAEAKSFLVQFIHSLHSKQKLFQEDSSYTQALETNFQGLDLESARRLHVEYHQRLDKFTSDLKQLLYLNDHIYDPECELSSLVNILPDSVTQEMVRKAGDLELQLHDALNRSEREHERVREALMIQKEFIGNHIAHCIQLQKNQAKRIKEKLHSLQFQILSLLTTEKRLVEEKLLEIKNQMSDLPEKWRLENLLKMKTELTKGMMEGLIHLTETKTLSRHLFNVESRPVDIAFADLKAERPHLVLFSLAGALLAFMVSYLSLLFQRLMKGLPLSLEQLKKLGDHICGEVSPACNAPLTEIPFTDLETLRRFASFLGEQKKDTGICAALLGEKNPDFSPNITSLLALRGKKSILVNCNFDKAVLRDDTPGLWHYLLGESETPLIRSLTDADWIPSGGMTPLATELFTQPRFSSLIAELKSSYDFVLLVSHASLDSTEAKEIIKHADTTLVTLCEETLEVLEPYRALNRGDQTRVAFIQFEYA